MKSLDILAWSTKIATIAQDGNRVIIELVDQKYAKFSPLLFENTLLSETIITQNDTIPSIGIINDTIPGDYGKSYLNKYFIDEFGTSASMIDRLSFIGSHTLGALEFRPSNEDSNSNQDFYLTLEELKTQSRKIYEGEHSFDLAKLIAMSNSAAGGAKAKAVIDYNPSTNKIFISKIHGKAQDGFQKSIIKFNPYHDRAQKTYNNKIKAEYVYYLLAKKTGLHISDSWLVEENGSNYFITQRFDIDENMQRLHMHSLAGIFSHDSSSFTMGYESLFRAGNMLAVSQEDKKEMFKTMTFNLVFANRDDHSKNFSFLMNSDGNWRYAPAYDLTYSVHNYGANWHQLTIDKKPAQDARELSIKKIARICNVENPLDILKEMIEIKHQYLPIFAKEYHLQADFVKNVLESTLEIDKRFS